MKFSKSSVKNKGRVLLRKGVQTLKKGTLEKMACAKFKAAVPGIFTMQCVCHSLARALSHAVQCLPMDMEELMSDIYNVGT